MSGSSSSLQNSRGAVAGPALALLFGALGSLLPGWAAVPIALYDPVGHTWRLARIGAAGGPGIEITFYGVYLCAAVAALLGAACGVALDRRTAATLTRPLLTAWSLTALGIATAYQLWTVWP